MSWDVSEQSLEEVAASALDTATRLDAGETGYFAVGLTVMLPPPNFIISYFYFLFFLGGLLCNCKLKKIASPKASEALKKIEKSSLFS